MRITFFSDIAMLGGGELWVLAIARWLRGRGHDVSIVCPHRSQLFLACVDRGLDVFGFNTNGNTPFHQPLFHFLRNHRTDVVYTTVIGQFCEAVELGAIVARLNAERVSGEPQGDPAAEDRPAADAPAEPGILRLRRRTGSKTPARRVGRKPAAVPVVVAGRRRFRQGDARRRRPDAIRRHAAISTHRAAAPAEHQLAAGVRDIGNDTRIITCVARLHPLKGLDNLLFAARDVLATRPPDADVRFVFAGQGGELARLQAMSRELKIDDRVHFLGHVQDVPALLAASDLFCYPSLADGLPNAVVEAMAMGLPVIASAVGGVPELIADGENGLLVTPQDVRQLTRSIARLLDDEALAARLGARAATSVRAQLDFNACCEAWEASVAAEHDAFQQDTPARHVARRRGRADAAGDAAPQSPEDRRRGNGSGDSREIRRSHALSDLRAHRVARRRAVARGHAAAPDGRSRSTKARTLSRRWNAKADYIVRKIRREGIRIVVACQDTKLAHQVFEQLRPDECRLIEHAGIEAEVDRIPKAFTSRLVGVSPAIARAAARHFPDRPERVRYLPSMVDVADYWGHDRAGLRDAYDFGSDIVIVFVGRMDAKKGITHLIDAAGLLLPDHPNLRFLVIGPPDAFQPAHAEHLLQRARTELPPNRFIFAGARDDVAQHPDRGRHLRAAVARRRHVARDQRSRRGGASGRDVRRWRGGAAARWRRGGHPRASWRYRRVRRGAATR